MTKIIQCTYLLFFSFGLCGCSLPANQNLDQNTSTDLKTKWLNDPQSDLNVQKGLTAYLTLDDTFLSISSRIYLIRNAKYSIDIQYYIWKDDQIGNLILYELLQAADRGVWVRLMVDDHGTQLDNTLKTLAQHPNFEIRLFNPYKFRNFRLIDYIFRFNHINHRMHNKLLIADNSIAITGGRNIGNEYFEASDQFQFSDLDILFYGATVDQAVKTFNQFWESPLNYSAPQLLGTGKTEDLDAFRRKYKILSVKDAPFEVKLNKALNHLKDKLQNQNLQWAKANFVADEPTKITRKAEGSAHIYTQILNIMNKPNNEIELVSAYFVPTKDGTDYLNQLSQDHVNIRILTNSLAANDVPVVHAFYSLYRKSLLENGVKLYEFKPNIKNNKRTWYEIASGNMISPEGRNRSSLHAKFFDADGYVFIGSFNFDPRSAFLNSEVGLMLESDELQRQTKLQLNQYLPEIAYELKLDSSGQIVWHEQMGNGEVKRYYQDPNSTWFQRSILVLVSYLPIEWMV